MTNPTDSTYARFLSDLATIVCQKAPRESKIEALRLRLDDHDLDNLEELLDWIDLLDDPEEVELT